MNTTNQPNLLSLILKSSVAHTLTYFLMGILAFNFLNYEDSFVAGALENYMRPTDSAWVAAGPGLQWIRGIIFALAFYPLREIFFGKKNGWLILGWVLTALGILSTFGAAPGSIEGMIYTNYPTSVFSYVEVVPQAFLFAGLLYYWVKKNKKKWMNWVLGIFFVLVVIMSVLGVMAATGILAVP